MNGLPMDHPTSKSLTRLSFVGTSMLELGIVHKRIFAVAAAGHETQRPFWTNSGTWLVDDSLGLKNSLVCIKRFGAIKGVSVRCRVGI